MKLKPLFESKANFSGVPVIVSVFPNNTVRVTATINDRLIYHRYVKSDSLTDTLRDCHRFISRVLYGDTQSN